MRNIKNAIILCSGGLDSVVCAYYVKRKLGYGAVTILFFDYGQRALKGERKAVRYFARELDAKVVEVKISLMNEVAGDLLGSGVANKVSLKELKDSKVESLKWYVPHRNLIFLSYAMSFAESMMFRVFGRYDIFVGFKNEGKESFPDTTSGFVRAVNKLRDVGSEKKFGIYAPLIRKDKEDIVSLGKGLGVKLDRTWSCYSGKEKQCGTCLACRLRQEGFYWANIKDETEYLERMSDFRTA
jgi:7-cyano-7-deazaguanine synthase